MICKVHAWPGFVLVGILLLCLMSDVKAAQTHVLLVGVSHYPEASGWKALQGPVSDVRSMREFWLSRDVPTTSIRVLAEPAVGGTVGLPERARIIAELERLGRVAKTGDFAFIFLSGHGSQVTAVEDPHEADGMDEVFVARDVTAATADAPASGVITDDELGRLVGSVRATGAFVWLLVDACHSGTMDRSDASATGRSIPHSLLNPQRTHDGVTVAAGSALDFTEDSDASRYVAFFAAQSHQEAKERSFPPDSQEVRGLFTTFVLQALADGGAQSFGDLALEVFNRQARWPTFQLPTPLFEGALDAPLPEQVRGPRTVASATGRIPVRWDRLRKQYDLYAGALAGLRQGERVTLYESAVDGRAGALAQATVSEVGAVASRLTIDDEAALLAKLAGSPTKWSLTAERSVASDTRVAVHLQQGGSCAVPAGSLESALRESDFIRIETDARAADFRLCFEDRPRQVLIARGAAPLSAGAADSGVERLELPSSQDGVSSALLSRLIEVHRVRMVRDFAAQFGNGALGLVETRFARSASGQEAQPVPPGQVPVLRDGDLIDVEILNPGSRPTDVTLIYVDSSERFVVVPYRGQPTSRIPPGGQLRLPPVPISGSPGHHALYVFAVEALDQAPPSDLSFFVDCRSDCGQTRGEVSSALEALMRTAVRAPVEKTRATQGQAAIETIAWQVAGR